MYRACAFLMLAMLTVCSGCTMCSSCDDYSYATYGGKWQRSDMIYGRVGSAFTHPGLSEDVAPVPAEIEGEPEEVMAGEQTQSVVRQEI